MGHPPTLSLPPAEAPGPAQAPLVRAAAPWLARHPRLPLPSRGHTLERWRHLAAIAAEDVCLAKLLEAHYDAQAILADLDAAMPPAGTLWGVWAAEGPDATLRYGEGRLHGSKPWCSGATSVSHALVTVHCGDARGLVAVALDQPGIHIDGSGWQAVGMQRIETARVDFDGSLATRVGPEGGYLARPGFWHGGAGIAACWFGAACAVADPLRRSARVERDPHAAAHLGAIDATLAAAAALLRQLAGRIDEQPGSPHLREVLQVRSVVEATAREVVDRVGRALGPAPLCGDHAHALRCADLLTFIRQHHGERDWQALGEQCRREDRAWTL